MLRLGLKKEPYWLDLLKGVRIQVRPLTTPLVMAARVEAAKAVEKCESEKTAEDQNGSNVIFAELFIKKIAQEAIIAWEGVGDSEGQELPVTPEHIEALMNLHYVYDAFDIQYYRKIELLDQEKNA